MERATETESMSQKVVCFYESIPKDLQAEGRRGKRQKAGEIRKHRERWRVWG